MEKSFHELLEHLCQLCHADNLDPDRDPDKPPKEVLYKSFKSLEQHVKRIHELFFCDLCVTNLKVSKKKISLESNEVKNFKKP